MLEMEGQNRGQVENTKEKVLDLGPRKPNIRKVYVGKLERWRRYIY